ncbi:hypothetical protein TWF506_001741 [Arthrobotrys conoides]|uniref:RNase MRP protein 1 RNA binding domain-containing protein n=1 Tax=Arthrobotrys conoides TaxID=74498 RepID=A0AAN8NP22_9PEZI
MPPPPPPPKPKSTSSTTPLKPPTSPKSLTKILTNDRNILHLLIYKTKNQHRASLWFKWIRMLKRSLERITDHLQSTYLDDQDVSSSNPNPNPKQNSNPDSDSDSESESDLEESTTSSLTTLLQSDKTFVELLQRLWIAIIPNAHRAFTTLITSTQYAGMGMVMLGCLARVHEVLKPFVDEKIGEAALEGRDSSIKYTKETTPLISYAERTDEEGDTGEDTGEVISRDSFVIQKHQRTRKVEVEEEEAEEGIVIKRQKVELQTTRRSLTPLTAGIPTSTKGPETRRTAIDDLFADF